MSVQHLISADTFSRELAHANTVPELKALVDKGEAVIEFMRKSGMFDIDTVRELAFARCEAIMKAGRLLEEMAPSASGRAGRNSDPRIGAYFGALKQASLKERQALFWRAASKIEPAKYEAWKAQTPELELPRLNRLYSLGRVAAAATEFGPHRTDRVEDLANLADSGQQFAAIYADPPWSFRVYSGKGKARSAENHYDTMDQTAIEGLGEHVQRLAAKDCALFMWAVMPQLPEALRVIESWGFGYKTAAFTWVKRNKSDKGIFTGMGYWTRSNAELCLLATKGSPKRQAKDVPQVMLSAVGRHSAKPEEAARRIERLVPGPYLEMFARRGRDNWTTWGNEQEEDLFTDKEDVA